MAPTTEGNLMREGSSGDKSRAVEIIRESFRDIPSVDWVIGRGKKREKRLKALAEYMVSVGLRKQGLYLSNDGDGVAILYSSEAKTKLWDDIMDDLKLVLRGIPLTNLLEALKRESYLKKVRPKHEYLYFWAFGVSDSGRGGSAAHEIKHGMFAVRAQSGLDILLETSVPRNRKVYERFGFEVFHTLEVPGQGIELWFMKLGQE